MKMVSMKRTKAEKKAESEKYDSPGKIGGEDYPYSTRVTLDHDMLDKLGVDTLPKVGSKMKLHSIAHVVSTSEDNDENGKKRRRVELRMHQMGVAPHTESDEDAKQGAKNAIDAALDGKAE